MRPVAAWLDDVEGYWDSDAERIHGIPRGEVEAEGVHPRDAMAALNGMVGDGVAHCDGGGFDERYLFLLAEGAGLSPTFRLAGVTELARCLDDGSGAGAAARVADFLVDDEGSVAHRAAADALRLLGFFLPRAPHKA